jgi:hypothetical protein
MMRKKTIKLTEREELEARMRVMPSGCIEWTGNIDGTGYGRFCFKRKIELAHRAAWRLLKGAIPAGACLLHKCDNPPCVNPDHLFLGDRGDNARDMASKGRQWIQQRPERRLDTLVCPMELRPRGETHGMSKLTTAQVVVIRERSSRGERGIHLAAEYGVARTLIGMIINGQLWRHAGGPIKAAKPKGKLP